MKLNINNRTNVPFEVIGGVYDKYLKSYYEVDTFNENLVEYQLFNYQKKDYKMKIEYKISCICILIEELEFYTKKESIKGIKFPKMPK